MAEASQPDSMQARLRGITRALDQVAYWSGWAVAWLILPMVAGLVYEVVGR